jgi:hypothetical protein
MTISLKRQLTMTVCTLSRLASFPPDAAKCFHWQALAGCTSMAFPTEAIALPGLGSGEDAHAPGHDPIGIAKQQPRCLLGRTLPALCASCADAKLDRTYFVVASSVRAPRRTSHRMRADARTPCVRRSGFHRHHRLSAARQPPPPARGCLVTRQAEPPPPPLAHDGRDATRTG